MSNLSSFQILFFHFVVFTFSSTIFSEELIVCSKAILPKISLAPSRYYQGEAASRYDNLTEVKSHAPSHFELNFLSSKDVNLLDLRAKPWDIVELGPGNGEKTKALLWRYLNYVNSYTAVDVSSYFLNETLKKVNPLLSPESPIRALQLDFSKISNFQIPRSKNARLILMLGQTLGNFRNYEEFLANLSNLHMLPGDRLLLGISTYENPEVLVETARTSYPLKAEGVLARELIKDLYQIHEEQGEFRIVVAQKDPSISGQFVLNQKQRIDGIKMSKSDSIEIFYSHRFREEQIDQMLENSGLRRVQQFTSTKVGQSLILLERI